MTIRRTSIAVGVLAVLAVTPAAAQRKSGPALDPQPEEPRMEAMMKMMGEMRDEMQRMHAEMGRMQGMGAMSGRMGGMSARMGEMRGMMERHRQQMMKQCPAMEAPARKPGEAPKPGS